MKNTSIKIDEAHEILYQNECLLGLMQGYCLTASQYIDEVESLLPAFKLVLDNQKKLWDKIDDIFGDVYKAVYPNFFGGK